MRRRRSFLFVLLPVCALALVCARGAMAQAPEPKPEASAAEKPAAADAPMSDEHAADAHAAEKPQDGAADHAHADGVADHAHADHGAHGGHHELGHGNASKSLEDVAEFRTDLAIYTFVVFLLLLAILGKFAWPVIVAALEERERYIAHNIAAAEARHDDAKKLLAEHEAKLTAAAGEVRAMLDEARRDAEHTRKRIEDEGHRAAKDELDRAVREIGRARDAAVQELAIASANVAVELARGVVRTEISADRQKQIVREAISKLGAAAPSKN